MANVARGPSEELDRSDAADARRRRWLLAGNGYFLENEMLCGHELLASPKLQDEARRAIDAAQEGEVKA